MTGIGRARAALLVGVLLTTAAACSQDPIDDYCDEVQAQQRALTEAAASTGSTGLLEALPSFEALRDKAPADIEARWVVVVQRVTVLRDALEAAGVDPATYDPESPPDDLSEEDRAAIVAAASGLLTDAMSEAFDGVQQQARDVCKTPLSL